MNETWHQQHGLVYGVVQSMKFPAVPIPEGVTVGDVMLLLLADYAMRHPGAIQDVMLSERLIDVGGV